MADSEYTTKLKIEADTKGADDVVKAHDRVQKKAEETKRSVGKGLNSLAEMGEKMKRITNSLINFSFLTGGLASVVSLWETITSKTREAKKAAEELAKENRKAADAAAVEKLAEAYGKLERSISSAAGARAKANELEDADISNARELEDLNATAEKDKELAALDPNDPLYERKKAQIEARYGAAAANRAAARKTQDAELKAKRTEEEAGAKLDEAGSRRLALVGDREELERLKSKRRAAATAATSDNYADNNTFGDLFFSGVKSIISGDWGRVGDTRSVEGDEIRKNAEARMKELDAQIKEKEKDIRSKEQSISDLEAEGKHLSSLAVRQHGAAENARDAQSVIAAQGHRSTTAADMAFSAALAENADAHRARAALTARRDELKAQIAATQGRKDAAGLAVFNAQGAVDLARANGGKGLAGAQGALADAQSTALSTNASADRLIAALTKALNDVNTKLKAAQTAIESQSKQTRYAWSEAPAGD